MTAHHHLYKNHMKFGYGEGQWFIDRPSPEAKFQMKWSSCERRPRSFREECIEAAKLIYENSTLPINILFSGGKDGQVCMRSFMAAKIPVTAYIARYANGLNAYDIKQGIDFCEAYSIPHKILDIDPWSFFENELWEYSNKYFNSVPFGGIYLWLVDQMDGHPVMSSFRWWWHHNWQQVGPKHNYNNHHPEIKNPWVIMTGEQKFALYRYYLKTGREGVWDFLSYTPEQCLAFLEDPYTKRMIQEHDVKPMTDYRYTELAKRYYEDIYVPYKQYTYWEAFSIPNVPSHYGFGDQHDRMQEYRDQLKKHFPDFGWQCDEYYTLRDQLMPPQGIEE